jgi:hypothetical protein
MALFKAGLTFGAILFIIITKEVRNLKIEGFNLPGNGIIPQLDNPLILNKVIA